MANEEHLAILMEALEKEDIGIWNKWRIENDIQPDLSEVDLTHANLRGVDFHDTHLRQSNFYSADLREANLSKSNLHSARFHGANLSQVNLSNAEMSHAYLNNANLANAMLQKAYMHSTALSGTNLNEANLRNANLNVAHLWNTNLEGADLTNAVLLSTIFTSIDLSGVKGLETVVHQGPSMIDIDTVYLSKGTLPDIFLRGCGVPETMITFAKSLVGAAIEFYSCFISYNSQDEAFCKQLAARMKDAGLRVWFAPDDIKGGKKIHEQVYEAIRYHDKLIVVLSEHSMNSNWVETEIRRARKRERDEKRRMLFPIRLVSYEALQDWELFDADEGRDLAQEIREYFIPDFSNWKDYDSFSAGFERLLADLRKDEGL